MILLVRGGRPGYYTLRYTVFLPHKQNQVPPFFKRFSPRPPHIIPTYVFLGMQSPCNPSLLDYQSGHFNTGRLGIDAHPLKVPNSVGFVVLIQLQEWVSRFSHPASVCSVCTSDRPPRSFFLPLSLYGSPLVVVTMASLLASQSQK